MLGRNANSGKSKRTEVTLFRGTETALKNPVIENLQLPNDMRQERGISQVGAHLVRVGDEFWAAYDDNPSTAPIIWPQSTAVATPVEEDLPRFEDVAVHIESLLGIFRLRLILSQL